MRAEVEIVSPAMAKEYLERKAVNRPVSDRAVDRYVRDMREENWQSNGQPIIFSSEGNLLDGQHRCLAVIKSQRSVAMLVVRGVAPKAFVTMDSGRGRSLHDVLAIEGYKYGREIQSIVRIAMHYVVGLRYTNSILTRADYEQFIQSHPYIATVGEIVSDKGTVPFSKGALGAVLFLGNENRAHDKEVSSFLQGFLSGEGLWKGDPRLTIREWLIARRRGPGTALTEELFGAFVRVWNPYATGKTLKIIRLEPKPTRKTLPIVGFSPHLYQDLPDLSGLLSEEKPRSNIKPEGPPPLEFPR